LASEIGTKDFPKELEQYSLTERLLQEAFSSLSEKVFCLPVDKPVTVGFYRKLHNYLQKCTSLSATKTDIGRFYSSIDPNDQILRISDFRSAH
jgi:hypothetical protein